MARIKRIIGADGIFAKNRITGQKISICSGLELANHKPDVGRSILLVGMALTHITYVTPVGVYRL